MVLVCGKGAPAKEESPSKEEDGKFAMRWLLKPSEYSDDSLVIFYGDGKDSLRASIVCERGGYNRLLGLGRFNTEQQVIAKLGRPTSESVHSNGLFKLISFKRWNVAYEIQKGEVTEWCVTNSGSVAYTEEYQQRGGQ